MYKNTHYIFRLPLGFVLLVTDQFAHADHDDDDDDDGVIKMLHMETYWPAGRHLKSKCIYASIT